LGLVDNLSKIFEKIPEFTDNISKILDNKDLQNQLEKAGSIGNLISLSLFVAKEIRNYFKTKEQIAFTQFIEIVLDAYQQSLSHEIKDIKIDHIGDNEFISGLFTYFIEDKWYPNLFDADNKIFSRFREQLENIVKESNRLSPKQKLNIINDMTNGFNSSFSSLIKEKRNQFEELDEILKRKERQATIYKK
jgi:hypothetical protein